MVLDLPSRAAAVALASIGYRPLLPRISRNNRSGVMSRTWTLSGPRINEAQQLIAAAEERDPALNLATYSPEDQYLCAIYYQEIRSALIAWRKTGVAPLVIQSGAKSRLLRLLPDSPKLAPYHLSGVVWSVRPEVIATIADPTYAAIAILCGFVPSPQIVTTPEGPAWEFQGESTTFPGLFMRDLESVRIDSEIAPYKPGDHPACIAVAAAINLANFAQAEVAAERNPTHQFRCKSGPGSALMSEDLLSAKNTFYRDKLAKHLATA